ncbi:hypothetical protein Taro_054755, partial [Colocasia esculenta]|nr:hypothetical protein [Colocasia esculenta]
LKIWFEDDVGLLQMGGERVVGEDLLPFLHLYHRPLHRYHRQTHDLCTGTMGSRTHDLCTATTGSRGIIDSQSIQMGYESYSRGMHERYGDDNQRPELDPDIWVEASGAPKKGHVYGFGHSLGTARVISSCSSSVSHATSPFTTPVAPSGSSSAAPTMTPDMFREIVNETVSQNISTIVSQTVSQTLTQLGILGDRAPSAQQPPDHPSRDVGRDNDQDDTYAEDL